MIELAGDAQGRRGRPVQPGDLGKRAGGLPLLREDRVELAVDPDEVPPDADDLVVHIARDFDQLIDPSLAGQLRPPHGQERRVQGDDRVDLDGHW